MATDGRTVSRDARTSAKKPRNPAVGLGVARTAGVRHTGRVIRRFRDEAPEVRLHVYDLVNTRPGHLTAIVRCMGSQTRLHARFHRINEDTAIDIELVGIEVYGIPIDQLDPVGTALVAMTGTGTDLIKAGDVVHGTNCPALPDDADDRQRLGDNGDGPRRHRRFST